MTISRIDFWSLDNPRYGYLGEFVQFIHQRTENGGFRILHFRFVEDRGLFMRLLYALNNGMMTCDMENVSVTPTYIELKIHNIEFYGKALMELL